MAQLTVSKEQPRSRSFKLVIPPIYIMAIVLGLGLAGVYIWLTTNSIAADPDLRRFLTRTAYPAFLTGAELIASGRGSELYSLAAQETMQQNILAPYNYPAGLLPYNHLPFLAVALSPFAGLALGTSYGAWAGATMLAMLAALVLLGREIREVARTPFEGKWATVALFTLAIGFFPVYHELSQAQTAAWVLLGYTAALRYLRRQREIGAGLLIVSGLLKPQLLPLPLLTLLLTRRWRALAAFAALSAVLALLVTPILGGFGWMTQYISWLTSITQGAGAGNIHPTMMENWRGFAALLAASFDGAGESAAWTGPLTIVATLLYLALIGWAWIGRELASDSAAWDLRWAATLLGGLLVSPHLLGYELTLWLLAGVLVWRAARRSGGPPLRQSALLLGVGYVMGTISLPLISIGLIPLHLGTLFMAVVVPLLIVWSKRAEAVQQAG